MLALVPRDPAEDDEVVVLAGGGTAVGAHGQRGGKMHVPDAERPQCPRCPRQLRERHAVHPQPAAGAVDVAVERGMLAQVPVQGVQHRGARSAERAEHCQPERLLVVVHERDVVAAAHLGHHPVQVRRRHAHHTVERALQLRELAVVEHTDALVDRQGARPDRRQHDAHPAPAQLRDERGQHVLDPAVSRRRHREPRAGVDQDGDAHETRDSPSDGLEPLPTDDRTDGGSRSGQTPTRDGPGAPGSGLGLGLDRSGRVPEVDQRRTP